MSSATESRWSITSSGDSAVYNAVERPVHFGIDMVVVLVGQGDGLRMFGVHQPLLVNDSPFFRNAFDGGHWKESQDMVPTKLMLETLIEAYLLGEKLQDEDSMDVIMDTIIACAIHFNTFPTELLGPVYEETLPGSPLRRILIDMFVYGGGTALFEAMRNNPCGEFLYDVLIGLIQQRDNAACQLGNAPFAKDTCTYHRHRDSGNLCYKLKISSWPHNTCTRPLRIAL